MPLVGPATEVAVAVTADVPRVSETYSGVHHGSDTIEFGVVVSKLACSGKVDQPELLRHQSTIAMSRVITRIRLYAPVVPIVTVHVIVSVSPACLSMFEYTARASIVPVETALKMPASRSAAFVPSPAAQVPT